MALFVILQRDKSVIDSLLCLFFTATRGNDVYKLLFKPLSDGLPVDFEDQFPTVYHPSLFSPLYAPP